MTCPVCKRELAPTLSICFTCGTMVQDSVREELQTKVGRVSNPLEKQVAVAAEKVIAAPTRPAVPTMQAAPKPAVNSLPQPKRSFTEPINKQTCQTLVEFQNKNASVPDWRLHLQNAVRQRKTDTVPTAEAESTGFQSRLVTNGANALKPQTAPEPEAVAHSNPKVAKALRRIEDSRRRFLNGDEPPVPLQSVKAPAKNYPFNVVSPSSEAVHRATRPATVNAPPKPRLVTSAAAERKGYDTNKLPPIPDVIAPAAKPARMVEPAIEENERLTVFAEVEREEIPEAHHEIVAEHNQEEIDDLAPLSSRLTAGVFDVIIGVFATAIVMSPLLMQGGNWFSLAGTLALGAAFGIVMFTYLTVAIGLRGRTVGMKLFSLEVIDVEENEYPTFHQAAVSSAVFILSLPLLGVGFLPALFNEERRAAHDLISGTLLVREV